MKLVIVAALALCACGIFGPAIPPAIDCSVRILDDALAGMTIAQIEADVAAPCGADIATIIAVLLASKSDAAHGSPAYREALRIRMQILDAGAQ